jgi:hypothetical protein
MRRVFGIVPTRGLNICCSLSAAGGRVGRVQGRVFVFDVELIKPMARSACTVSRRRRARFFGSMPTKSLTVTGLMYLSEGRGPRRLQ